MLYEIHDNGGRPWIVAVDKQITVTDSNDLCRITTPLCPFWAGTIDAGSTFLMKWGNSTRHLWIGRDFRFLDLDEEIEEFHTEISNSDVPYPYIVTKNWIWLLIAKVRYPRALGKGQYGDPHHFFWHEDKKIPHDPFVLEPFLDEKNSSEVIDLAADGPVKLCGIVASELVDHPEFPVTVTMSMTEIPCWKGEISSTVSLQIMDQKYDIDRAIAVTEGPVRKYLIRVRDKL